MRAILRPCQKQTLTTEITDYNCSDLIKVDLIWEIAFHRPNFVREIIIPFSLGQRMGRAALSSFGLLRAKFRCRKPENRFQNVTRNRPCPWPAAFHLAWPQIDLNTTVWW